MLELFEIFEIGVYILLVLALLLNVYILKSFGKGVLNIVFLSFGMSIVFLGVYFLFMRFAEDNVLFSLSEATMFTWAHGIVYLSMLALIWGGYRIKKASETENAGGLNSSDGVIYGLLSVILVGLLLTVQPMEMSATKAIEGSAFDELGLHHFTVFILGGISFWYLRYIKGNWGLLSDSMTYVMYFLLLIGIQHLWEVLTESWKVITLESTYIEGVETIIIFAALALFCVGQSKIIKFIKG